MARPTLTTVEHRCGSQPNNPRMPAAPTIARPTASHGLPGDMAESDTCFSVIVSDSRHCGGHHAYPHAYPQMRGNGQPILDGGAHESANTHSTSSHAKAIRLTMAADHYVLPVSGKQRRIIGERDGIPHHGKQVGEEYAVIAPAASMVLTANASAADRRNDGNPAGCGICRRLAVSATDNRGQREQQA